MWELPWLPEAEPTEEERLPDEEELLPERLWEPEDEEPCETPEL